MKTILSISLGFYLSLFALAQTPTPTPTPTPALKPPTMYWMGNPDPDVTGYIIEWGAKAGNYTGRKDVPRHEPGKLMAEEIEGAPRAAFFVITACNKAGICLRSVEIDSSKPAPAPPKIMGGRFTIWLEAE